MGITSKDVSVRWKEHLKAAIAGSGCYFHNAIRKYGDSCWVTEILEFCDNFESAKVSEQKHIMLCNSYYENTDGGYNMTLGGEGIPGYTHSESTRLKIGESNKGKHRSQETREKIKNANIGRAHTEEAKQKISDAGKNREVTEATRMKIGNALKGRKHSDASCENMRDSHLGKKHSEETKAKMSERRKGVEKSETHKEKMRESMKRYWANKKALIVNP